MANLTQLRMLESLDGILLVDKPEGLAFTTVVKTVKRLFNLVKVGHGGSLDAMASGLLVLLIGDANRFVDQVMGADRAYTGSLALDGTTNTGDAHGAPLQNPKAVPMEELRGDVFQSEPRFAAIRREGSGDYDLVETGDHAPALGHVYKFEIGDAPEGARAGSLPFVLRATKGILPRALAYDLNATLTSLRRTRVGVLKVEDATTFDAILKLDAASFAALVRPVSILRG